MRRLHIPFLLQCIASALMTTSSSMMAVMVPLYAVSLGLGPEWLGVLIALPGIFPVLLALQAGRIVDRGGPGRWLLIGLLGMAAAPAVLLAFPGTFSLALSRIIVGAFVMFVSLSAQSLTATIDNRRSHQANFGVYSTWLAGGRMLGPVLMGVILDNFGFPATFWTMLGLLLAAALFAYLLYRRVGSQSAREPAGVVGAGSEFRSIINNVGFQVAVFASAGIFLALTVREAFLPVMLEQLGMSATLIGTLVSIGSGTSVVIRLWMPQVVRLLGGTGRTLVATMAAVAIGIGLLSVAKSVAAFVVLAVVVGFGTGIGFPLSIVAVATHVPPRQRGMALGLRLSTSHLVETFVPALAGLLVGVTSFAVGFGAAGALLGVLTFLSARRLPRFEAAEREHEAPVVTATRPAEGGEEGAEVRAPAPEPSAPEPSAPEPAEGPQGREGIGGREETEET